MSRMGNGADVFSITAGCGSIAIRDGRPGAAIASRNVQRPLGEFGAKAAGRSPAESRIASSTVLQSPLRDRYRGWWRWLSPVTVAVSPPLHEKQAPSRSADDNAQLGKLSSEKWSLVSATL